MSWMGRATANKFPPSTSAAIPSYSQQVLEAQDSRIVRSEAELRQALSEITAQLDSALANTAYSFKAAAKILVAAPIRMGSKLTIPSSCAGLELGSIGFSPLYFPQGVDYCFDVKANFVTFRDINFAVEEAPAPGTMNGIYFDSVQAFRMLGGMTGVGGNAFAGTCDGGLFDNIFMQNADINGDFSSNRFSSLNTCGDLTLDGNSNNNTFSGCDIGDASVAGARNVFSSSRFDSFVETGSADYNALVGNYVAGILTIIGANSVGSTTVNS